VKNLPYKLLALALAVTLWFVVVGEERVEIGLTIPLELINIPRDLIVVNNVTQGIDIRINGPRSLVRSISPENLSKRLDLSQTREGTVTFSISSEGISLPRGVKITRIHPTTVVVVLQKLSTKLIPIRPRLVGRPAPERELESVRIYPEKIEIAGPAEVLEKLDTLWTKPLDLAGVKESFKKKAPLDFRSLQIYPVKEVAVEVEILLKGKAKNP
jgi:YbbR domain-containing protein